MEKKKFYTEPAYIIGLMSIAFATALMEAADFGVSMVVAPAYIIYLKLSPHFSFFTFGMAEYTLQAFLLILLIVILRKFKASYLFSFVTAVIYGFMLDGFMALVAFAPAEIMAVRIVFFVAGVLICTFGVSMMFHSYIPPEVYELLVKEISVRFNLNIHKVKTVYDCTSCVIAIILSFVFFGMWHFEGVKFGTIICALINGFLVGRWTHLLEKHFVFTDKFRKKKKSVLT